MSGQSSAQALTLLDRCLKGIRQIALRNLKIPLAIFSHAVVNCLKSAKGFNHIYETTLELIQYVSIKLVHVDLQYIANTGDKHQCVLFCEKCQEQVGSVGELPSQAVAFSSTP